jgi:hypothetical protein
MNIMLTNPVWESPILSRIHQLRGRSAKLGDPLRLSKFPCRQWLEREINPACWLMFRGWEQGHLRWSHWMQLGRWVVGETSLEMWRWLDMVALFGSTVGDGLACAYKGGPGGGPGRRPQRAKGEECWVGLSVQRTGLGPPPTMCLLWLSIPIFHHNSIGTWMLAHLCIITRSQYTCI